MRLNNMCKMSDYPSLLFFFNNAVSFEFLMPVVSKGVKRLGFDFQAHITSL